MKRFIVPIALAAALAPNVLGRARHLHKLDPALRTPVLLLPIETPNTALFSWVARLTRYVPIPQKSGPGVTTSDDGIVRVHAPEKTRIDAVFLWLHGGGHALGGPSQDDGLLQFLAGELGVTVVAPHLRMAPENPYPADLNDAFAALKWVHSHYGPKRLAIGGSSAGGGLAASLAQRAFDEGIDVDFQLLIYPMLDRETVRRIPRPRGAVGRFAWTPSLNRAAWEIYGDGDYASPAARADLSGLPEAFILVGQYDLFRDEDKAYAERLTAAGVTTRFVEVAGAIHNFDNQDTPLRPAFRQRVAGVLREALTAG